MFAPDYIQKWRNEKNGSTPAHWLISRDVALDSLQLRVQEVGQQLENKVLLLLTWHVPTHTQGCHISSSAPVLERTRERSVLRKLSACRESCSSSTGTTGKKNQSAPKPQTFDSKQLRKENKSHNKLIFYQLLSRLIKLAKYREMKKNKSKKIKSIQNTE